MQRTIPGARIEIVENSRQLAPEGEIEFPRSRLQAGAAGALWTGYVRYATSRRFAIWARVRVTLKIERIVAIGDLRPGKRIAAGDLMAATRDEFPGIETFPITVDEVIGRAPRVPIHAGSAIRTVDLDSPKEVLRGDTVVVEVSDGRASLTLEAQAESSGATGQSVLVRNPTSGKRFRARVEGKGTVSVDASLDPLASKVNP